MMICTWYRKRGLVTSLVWRTDGPWVLGRVRFATCTHYCLGPFLLTVDVPRKPR